MNIETKLLVKIKIFKSMTLLKSRNIVLQSVNFTNVNYKPALRAFGSHISLLKLSKVCM